MGEVIYLELERLKRDEKRFKQSGDWLQAHQNETQKFLDNRREFAFADLDPAVFHGVDHVLFIRALTDTEDGTRDGV